VGGIVCSIFRLAHRQSARSAYQEGGGLAGGAVVVSAATIGEGKRRVAELQW